MTPAQPTSAAGSHGAGAFSTLPAFAWQGASGASRHLARALELGCAALAHVGAIAQPVVEPAAGAVKAGARWTADRLRRAWKRTPWPLKLALPPALLGLAVAGSLLHYIHADRTGLPGLEPFLRFEPLRTGHVVDARGESLVEIAKEYRRVITYQQVPPVLRQAVLSAEDKRFFEHEGIDWTALPRVAFHTAASSLLASRRAPGEEWTLVFPQGGSTVTQQLVRGYFLRQLTSLENGHVLLRDTLVPRALAALVGVPATNKLVRKLEEMRLSLWLEEEMARRFGSRQRAKEEIFARYASLIYLGHGRYGFSAAADYYFGKPLASFALGDEEKAALLAGITKSPREYAPAPGHLEAPLRRRNEVLALMEKNGFLSPAGAFRAQRLPLKLARQREVKTEAPAVVDTVLDDLKKLGGERSAVEALVSGEIQVATTVDLRIQRIVNRALESGLAKYEARRPWARGKIQGSVVVLRNRDAAILAEAGGRALAGERRQSYTDFNRATDARRQPGSAMKPIVYLAALKRGIITLDSRVPDAPIAVPMGWGQPAKWIANYDGKFKGMIPVRQALAESRNAVAMWLTQQMGIKQVLRTAAELGIESPLFPYPTTALGASEVRLVELANAYRAMASGIVARPHAIESIQDVEGGLRLRTDPQAHPLPPEYPLLEIQAGLRGVVRLPSGTAHALDAAEFGIPVMGKTGTTNDFRDAVFVGSTYGPDGITVGVRVGFDDNRQLGPKETGGRTALPVFREILAEVYGQELVGPAPAFPEEIELGIDEYLAFQAEGEVLEAEAVPPAEEAMPSLSMPVLAVPAMASGPRREPVLFTASDDHGRR